MWFDAELLALFHLLSIPPANDPSLWNPDSADRNSPTDLQIDFRTVLTRKTALPHTKWPVTSLVYETRSHNARHVWTFFKACDSMQVAVTICSNNI